MTNLFGFDIEGLNVPVFLSLLRVAFVVVALAAAARLRNEGDDRRAGRVLLGVAIAGHALAWLATMFPLPSVYGTNGSQDRENHLGWANVVALGFSPLRTFQVNHIHFEPVWPLLTAIASGFNTDVVPLVFQWAPLVMGLAVLGSMRFAWSRALDSVEPSAAMASFAAMGAVLLMSVPEDFTGPFRNPWALTFLLKPNHALGLVLTPLALLAIARARDWKTRLLAGFVLQLVGWAFVIHMALVVAGLLVFVALSWFANRPERKHDLVDVSAAIGFNLAIVSPYLVMLLIGYPLRPTGAHTVSLLSERSIEAPLRMGILFLLSAAGAWFTHARGTRLGRMLAAQWLAAHLVWQAFPLLGLIGQAREQDEAFYWCRFWTGAFAASGLFELVTRFPRFPRPRALPSPSAAAALILLLPSLLPAFWSPDSMDQYFAAARKPQADWIAEPTRFVREHTPKDAVFGGDREYARWIAAFGARRVLVANSLNAPNDTPSRDRAEIAILRGESGPDAETAARAYGIQYLLVTSRLLEQAPDITIEQLLNRPALEVVFDRQYAPTRVVIFRLRSAGAAR